ncbi:hypothetical protein K439DRAFT_1341413 [Ramaria rubella]|nr:hypothetical protein K439DRAFT_1341413 [Ramaria rubella]
MSHFIEPMSLKNYSARLIHFTKFCDDFNIPETRCMPASESLLCTFISKWGAGSVGKGSICTWLEGLKLWHQINSAPGMGASLFTPDTSHHAKRDPITFEHIKALCRHLDLTNSFDVAVLAVATIAFWSCCRLGELLINSTFDFLVHVSRSTHIEPGITSNGFKFISVHVPCTKTKPKGDNIIITDSWCSCSPTSAFEHHILANAAVPPHAPLFSFITDNGSWSPMKRCWFMSRCNEIWLLDNLTSMKGHGFRIGSTTFLLLCGIDPWVVMVQGRWTSQSFLTYWRKCKEILPLFIGFSFQSHSSILSTMSTFKFRSMGQM